MVSASTIRNLDATSLRTTLRGLDNINMTATFRALDDVDFNSIIRKLDTETLQHVAKNLDDDVIVRVLKNLDDDVVQSLAKNLDSAQLTRISNLDPDLARRIGVADANLTNAFRNAGVADDGVQNVTMLYDRATGRMRTFLDNANVPKGTNFRPGKALDEAATPAAKKQVLQIEFDGIKLEGSIDDLARVTGRPRSEIESLAEATADLAEAVPDIKTAAKKLGMLPAEMFVEGATFLRKHWMKIGACMVLLCMIYNTNNPFTALDRALEDIDDIVDGIKDIADSAADAGKNALEGGFDFITFITQNWWLSALCCFMIIVLAMVSALGVK